MPYKPKHPLNFEAACENRLSYQVLYDIIMKYITIPYESYGYDVSPKPNENERLHVMKANKRKCIKKQLSLPSTSVTDSS
jgi:hypothetical protein